MGPNNEEGELLSSIFFSFFNLSHLGDEDAMINKEECKMCR